MRGDEVHKGDDRRTETERGGVLHWKQETFDAGAFGVGTFGAEAFATIGATHIFLVKHQTGTDPTLLGRHAKGPAGAWRPRP